MLYALTVCLLTAYPTPAEAGFHHCALIYDAPQRTAADLAYYVADDRRWLFDAFLFLIQTTPGGGRPMQGGTTLADWQYHLDRWFADGRDVAELERAVAAAAGKLGPTPPRQVMFSIPRPDPTVTDFGDVDGDGASESLATPDGRRKVLDWYLDTLRRRFEALAPQHLALWGGYVMAETIPPGDEPLALEMAAACHERGLKLLWIPWYRATGWDRWRECGIDVAIMQPNYAFFTVHHGRVRRDRLANCADLAAKHGLGVELELAMAWQDPEAERLWRHYLCDGAASKWGYQQAASAWYLGTNNVEAMARSQEPRLRGMYDAMVGYLAGQATPEPEPKLTWFADGEALGWLSDGDLRLDTPRPLPAGIEVGFHTMPELDSIDLVFDHAAPQPWYGQLRLMTLSYGHWSQAASYLLAPPIGQASSAERFSSVVFGVSNRDFTVRLEAAGDGPPANVSEILCNRDVQPPAPFVHRGDGVGRRYKLTPPYPRVYGDEGGHQLTDGYIPSHGFAEHRSVGWWNAEVGVSLWLGKKVRITGAEVVLQGGGYAGVNWPKSAVLMLSNGWPPPDSLRGGSLTAMDGGWYAATTVEVVAERSPADQDGLLRWTVPGGVEADYAGIVFQGSGWLMLHELRILGENGENLAAGLDYYRLPEPTLKDLSTTYPDDGYRLTDGVIASEFRKGQVSGWADDDPRVITFECGGEMSQSVSVHALGGGQHGIWAPESVTIEMSDDQQDWEPVRTRPPDTFEEDGTRTFGIEWHAHTETTPKWFRVTVRRSQGWAMLSEIEVY